jgi:hypothetical protein
MDQVRTATPAILRSDSMRNNSYTPGSWLLGIGVILLFTASFDSLSLLGWDLQSENSPLWLKLHPSVYLFAGYAVIGLLLTKHAWSIFLRPFDVLFILSVCSLVVLAIGGGGGLLSFVLVTFAGFLALYISIRISKGTEIGLIRLVLSAFFICNSVLAILERALSFHLIPSIFDLRTEAFRSTAFLGHPLNNACITGCVIVILSSRLADSRFRPLSALELALHFVAIFCFGSRAAIILAPALICLQAILPRFRSDAKRPHPVTRLLPLFLLIVLGIVLLSSNSLLSSLTNRFQNDYGSTETRNTALIIMQSFNTQQIAFGMSVPDLGVILKKNGIPVGFESAWLALVAFFGLVRIIPLTVGLFGILLNLSFLRERGAFWSIIFFMLMCSTSMSFGTKSLLLMQLLVLIAYYARGRGTESSAEILDGSSLVPSGGMP